MLSTLREIRESYDRVATAHSRADELWDRWERLPDNHRYATHLRWLQTFKEGSDPLPDRESIQALLRRVGHDFAVVEALRPGSFIKNLLRSGHINREDYSGLHATVAACLTRAARPLSNQDVQRLYDTVDRLLRAGETWRDVREAPAVTGSFYRELSNVKIPWANNLALRLNELTEAQLVQRFGDPYRDFAMMTFSSLLLLTVAVAHRHGRRTANLDDAMDAGFAFASLFEADLHDLPPLVRTGKTGYELPDQSAM